MGTNDSPIARYSDWPTRSVGFPETQRASEKITKLRKHARFFNLEKKYRKMEEEFRRIMEQSQDIFKQLMTESTDFIESNWKQWTGT